MRRKAGIAVGACAALLLTGSAGAAAWATYGGDDGRTVGTWHDAPVTSRSSVTTRSPASRPDPASREERKTVGAPAAEAGPAHAGDGPVVAGPPPARKMPFQPEPDRRESAIAAQPAATGESAVAAESATTTPAEGRQQVGRLLKVGKLLGYATGAPQAEKFAYPGASYVKLHFGRMAMRPGDYLTVANGAGTESYRYDAGTAAATGRWAMSVTGDTAVLRMHRRAGAPDPALGVTVDRVARGFSRTEQAKQPESGLVAPARTGKEESVCGSDTATDAVCYQSSDPVAYTKSKAIARLLINGTELCTGWRVGPNNRMLTNNHCLTTSAAAFNTEVWFNYQCAKCGGYDVLQPTKVWGAKVLATDHSYDYTLFTLANFASVRKFGYLALDTTRPAKGQELYVPQHPAGEPAKIAGSLGDKAGNCSVADPDYNGYVPKSDVSYYCDTEGGSSGSPVLSRRTNRVVALHHFGGCPNSGVRGDLVAAKLRTLL